MLESVIIEKQKYSIGIYSLMNNILEEEFKYKRNDDLKLTIPLSSDNLFLNSLIGIFPKTIQNELIKSLSNYEYYIEKTINYENLEDLLMNNILYPNKIIKHSLKSYKKKSTIFYFNENEIFDIIDYWNLRANGYHILPIPLSNNNTFLKSLIPEFVKDDNSFVEIISTINKNIIKKTFKDYLGTHKFLSIEKYPLFWICNNDISIDITIDSIIENINIDNRVIQLNLPKRKITNLIAGKFAYKYDIDYYVWDNYGDFANAISGISTRDWMNLVMSSDIYGDWKITNKYKYKYVGDYEDRIFIKLPTPIEFFKTYFKNLGLELMESAKTKLTKELIKNLEGAYGINIFYSEEDRTIIRLFQDKKYVLHKTLINFIKKEFQNKYKPESFIAKLIEKKIIDFGCEIYCNYCGHSSFYQFVEIKETIKCNQCFNYFELPKSNPTEELKFAYKGIGLFEFSKSIEHIKTNEKKTTYKTDGVLCELLTIRFFHFNISDDKSHSFVTNVKIKELDNEFDIVFMTKDLNNYGLPQLFIIECKSNNSIKVKDIERFENIAEKMDNVILTIATLKNEFSDEEKKLIEGLINFYRKSIKNKMISVLLLTREELTSYDGSLKFIKNINSLEPFQEDFFHKLGDLTCKKYLGIKTREEILFEERVARII